MIIGTHFPCDEIDGHRLVFLVATSLSLVHPAYSQKNRPQAVLQHTSERAALPTQRDFLRDLDCQLQRRRSLRTRNARLASRACAFDERRELKLKRFPVFDLDSVTPNL